MLGRHFLPMELATMATPALAGDGGEDEGKWRANAEIDMYESWWRSTGWTPYSFVMTNDGHAWVNGESLEPFQEFEGKQVSW